MDLRLIKKLIDLVEASSLTELEVRSGEESVRIVRGSGAAAPVAIAEPPGAVPVGTAARGTAAEHRGEPVLAPMAGTFYAAPEPGADPYVRLGDTVAAGDVLCILESMKMHHEIVAERDGTCVGIAVGNGDAVAAGDPLIWLA